MYCQGRFVQKVEDVYFSKENSFCKKIGMDESRQKVQTILFAVNCIVGQFWCLQKQVNKILQATGVEYLPIIVVRKVIGLDKRVRQYGLGNRAVTDRSPMAARLYTDRLTAKL